MTTIVSRINITLSKELIAELKKTVPKRKRSKLIAEALEEKLTTIKRKAALEKLKGAWDKAGGTKFSSDEDLALWRKNLWASFDKRMGKK